MGTNGAAILTSALEQCARSADPNNNAWTLRRALDKVAEDSSSQSAASSPKVSSINKSTIIHDFQTDEGLDIQASVVNDTVMGGRSDSTVSFAEGALFQGTVTKRGGGGFASVRFQPTIQGALSAALQGKNGIAFIVRSSRGCRAWKLQLNEGYDGTTWQAGFNADSKGIVQRIPFSAFVPTWRGRPQGSPGLKGNSLASIRSFGFMLSFLTADGAQDPNFEEGPFFALHLTRRDFLVK